MSLTESLYSLHTIGDAHRECEGYGSGELLEGHACLDLEARELSKTRRVLQCLRE